ncbi:tRNA (guanosine(46)-N7)-methyltransferase TrmB [Aquirhabdus parva]|uniref:tRNA (guanine-N(7)-)-methyltransferase n=1 Tax=Aquirhabdus parva TaxID=2283318 RepID=A0A345P6R0_9GAMM|nr:tRNA (guanosine(46)-N7)-methyltransferase TrmB [Aquirhabdus parva]AXI02969.1 tRNA (guanosine(46)-N7)-methyltransferase TrmB [Aquirhabdus parva]
MNDTTDVPTNLTEAVNDNVESGSVKDESEDKSLRPILTFMRRSSPLNTSQERGLDEYAHLIVKAPISDARNLFEHPEHPLTIEIGFGMGTSLVQMAIAAPERNFLGIEVHIPGIAQCAFEAGQAGINNLRIMDADALEVLAGIPDGSVDRVQLFFPDPWQKKRHHKRRFVAPERMALIVQKLTMGGWFHSATDWQPYSEWMIDVLEQVPGLENVYGKAQFAPRPEWRPQTKFERRGEAAGHGVWDVIYKRV